MSPLLECNLQTAIIFLYIWKSEQRKKKKLKKILYPENKIIIASFLVRIQHVKTPFGD